MLGEPPRGTWVEDLQRQQRSHLAAEQKADVGGRDRESSEASGEPAQRKRASWPSEPGRAGESKVGGRKTNSRMLVSQLSEAIDVQLDTEGIASLFVSLTQYKQITHGPMEPAKH